MDCAQVVEDSVLALLSKIDSLIHVVVKLSLQELKVVSLWVLFSPHLYSLLYLIVFIRVVV